MEKTLQSYKKNSFFLMMFKIVLCYFYHITKKFQTLNLPGENRKVRNLYTIPARLKNSFIKYYENERLLKNGLKIPITLFNRSISINFIYAAYCMFVFKNLSYIIILTSSFSPKDLNKNCK
jgi:hypothetical protein